jgi:hypothetical protein
MLADAANNSMLGHRPGWIAPLTDEQVAQRQAALDSRQQMIDRSTEAWRGPQRSGSVTTELDRSRRKPDDDDDDDEDEDSLDRELRRDTADAARVASYQAMCLRLQDAWRRPVAQNAPKVAHFAPGFRDGAQLNLGTRPEELMGRHLRTDPDDDAQAKRDQAYAEYSNAISQAWKNPPGATQPANASRIERARERMTAEMK